VSVYEGRDRKQKKGGGKNRVSTEKREKRMDNRRKPQYWTPKIPVRKKHNFFLTWGLTLAKRGKKDGDRAGKRGYRWGGGVF